MVIAVTVNGQAILVALKRQKTGAYKKCMGTSGFHTNAGESEALGRMVNTASSMALSKKKSCKGSPMAVKKKQKQDHRLKDLDFIQHKCVLAHCSEVATHAKKVGEHVWQPLCEIHAKWMQRVGSAVFPISEMPQ